MTSRAILLVGALVISLGGCGDATSAKAPAKPTAQTQAAGGIGDPVRFVKAAYGADNSSPDKPSSYAMLDQDKPEYTPRLRALFAIQQREQGKDEVGRLDMDIYTGAQDGTVSDVTVEPHDVDYASPPRKVVIVRFKLEGQPRIMKLYFEQQGGRWYLDDIAAPGEGTKDGMPAWTLSTILKYGWW